jgi:hypothetical protein
MRLHVTEQLTARLLVSPDEIDAWPTVARPADPWIQRALCRFVLTGRSASWSHGRLFNGLGQI